VTGVKDAELERAGDMLGAAIISAAREASDVLEAFDQEAWTDVLTQVLAPQVFALCTDNVIDLGSFVLSRLAELPPGE
jgi:hypothetical protein